MKLSEIVNTHTKNETLKGVSYSWHCSGGKKENNQHYAFVLSVSAEVLRDARFREGDNADLNFAADSIEIMLSPSMPFSLIPRFKNAKSRTLKASARGVENVMSVLPNRSRPVNLEIVKIEVGKITVKIPKQ
jgi:hypothetical protein